MPGRRRAAGLLMRRGFARRLRRETMPTANYAAA
jgi:hypothetical protein